MILLQPYFAAILLVIALAVHDIIQPGKIDTDMYHSIGEDKVEEGIKEIGFKRLGTPREVADTALYLASDMGAYITGQIIGVNGGIFI